MLVDIKVLGLDVVNRDFNEVRIPYLFSVQNKFNDVEKTQLVS